VAVPAVVGYNQLSARIRIFASAIDDFARELLNSLEEIPVRTNAAGVSPRMNQPGPGPEMPREAERGVYK
jgi:biopolymer transport protein TolQ